MIEKRNIFLIGPSGSGKSTIGKYLSKKLHMDFFDSDQEIEKRTGANISWVFDIEGEVAFRKREEKIINEITQKQGIILATGVKSIISKNIRNYLSSRGIIIYLNTTIEKQLLRIKKDKNFLSKDIKPINFLKKIAIECNHFYEEIADIIIETHNHGIGVISKKIINLINKQN